MSSSAPLDQYVAAEPRWLVGAPVEQARIDPDNVEILIQHLKCAAFELPFEQGEQFGDLPVESLDAALGFLADHRVVHPVTGPAGGTVYHWAADAYPAASVSLRSVGWDNFVIIDLERGKTIAEMDWRSVHTMLHEQAIYQHMGDQYQVERLDYENHKAFVRRVEPDYYTTALTHTKVTVLDTAQRAGAAGLGEISVIERVVGYKKIKFHTHENVGYGDVHLPEIQMHTSAFWLTVSESLVSAMPAPRPAVLSALRAVGHAMHTVAALGLMIDPRDLGYTLSNTDETSRFDPTLFLYDQVPGGIGLAPRLFDEREMLLRRTRSLVEGCGCDAGCPACIGPPVGTADTPSPDFRERKALARRILAHLGAEPTH